MNRILCLLLLVLAFEVPAVAVIANRIIETSKIERILDEVDEDTVVFFDIDDTLLCRATMFSSSPWWHYCTAYVSKSLKNEERRKSVITLVNHAALKTKCKPVDPQTSLIIKDFQERGIRVFGLTARYMCSSKPAEKAFDLFTKEELEEIGIQFTPFVEGEILPCFRYGTIFTSSRLKGPFLAGFLKLLGKDYKKVVFIDDNWSQIHSVQAALVDMQIQSVCFRYSKVEKDNKKFDPLIGNIQLRELVENKKLLTNEEAQAIAEGSEFDPNFYLDEMIEMVKLNSK